MSDEPTRTTPPPDTPTRSGDNGPPTDATASRLPRPGASDTDAVTRTPPPGGMPAVPGYELLDELDQGGMGVVYHARDLRLNRVVALKMVLGADQADPRRLVRFLAEAEAVAAVRHPHVVQVYEFGEAGGRPFIALEYLSGGTLATRLGSPLPARSAAELLAKVARGVAAAHELGIVHRDLKPGNVLFDEAGEPKVTDFGLAKRAGGSDLTATQAVMGTPAYMSPEQAGGNTKFVGPTADVWGLGVILYECLTGSRPFGAADVQGILAQVLLANPRPPRHLVPSIPRDVELICLKCLSREPHERYPTARELGDDLERFARGETISVRPAGPLERGYKWVRRNKVVAGLLTAVALALVAGSAVALAFGLEAKREADRADRERDAAVDLGKDLARVNDDLQRANDDLLGTVARSLLAPIPVDGGFEFPPSLPEIDAFRELAARRGTPVAYRFIDEATRTPLGRMQLANRAGFALHAAVGLDAAARDRAERLLAGRLDDPGLGPEERAALARVVWRLGGLTPELAERCGGLIADAAGKLEGFGEPGSEERLMEAVNLLAGGPGHAQPERAAALLVGAMGKTTGPYQMAQFAPRLLPLIRQLPPERAAAVCDQAATILLGAMGKGRDAAFFFEDLAPVLPALLGLMRRERAEAVCERAVAILLPSVGKTQELSARDPLPAALAALADHLAPEKAAATCNQAVTNVMAALDQTKNPVARARLAAAVGPLARHVGPARAAEVCDRAAGVLLESMKAGGQTKPREALDVWMRLWASPGLTGLTEHLEPGRAAALLDQAATILLDIAGSAPNGFFGADLASGLAAVAGRLEPARRDAVCSRSAAIVVEAIEKISDAQTLGTLAENLVVLAGGMEPPRAATACARAGAALLARIERAADNEDRYVLATRLGVLAGRMPPPRPPPSAGGRPPCSWRR